MRDIVDGTIESDDRIGRVERPETNNQDKLNLVDHELFSSNISKHVYIFFSQEKIPTRNIHAFMPFISYVRSLLIPILVLGLVSTKAVQVAVVMVVEVTYMFIYFQNNNKSDVWVMVIDIVNCISNSLYVILKMILFDNTVSREAVAVMMIWMLMVNMIVNVLFVVFRSGILIKKRWDERRKLTDKEKKENDMKSEWKETCIFRYVHSRMISPSVLKQTENTKLLDVQVRIDKELRLAEKRRVDEKEKQDERMRADQLIFDDLKPDQQERLAEQEEEARKNRAEEKELAEQEELARKKRVEEEEIAEKNRIEKKRAEEEEQARKKRAEEEEIAEKKRADEQKQHETTAKRQINSIFK